MKDKFKSIFYLFFPLFLGIIVGIIISGNIDYNMINKPFLSPPKILFPIVWSMLYILMGLSYFIIKYSNSDTKTINYVYYTQLFFNISWSIIFFVFKYYFISIIWIIILDILVIYMIYLFYKSIKLCGYLNIPYLIWILFATYLTISTYFLN